MLETSGLMLPSRLGPRELNEAMTSFLSTAPTVITLGSSPGQATDLAPGPLLPAAMTQVTPALMAASRASSLACECVLLPSDMEMTWAPFWTAHWMPLMMLLFWPEPSLPSTLATIRLASGATPLYWPLEAAPVPAMVLDTWVPWPWSS